MNDPDIDTWENEGGAVPPELEPVYGPSPLRWLHSLFRLYEALEARPFLSNEDAERIWRGE